MAKSKNENTQVQPDEELSLWFLYCNKYDKDKAMKGLREYLYVNKVKNFKARMYVHDSVPDGQWAYERIALSPGEKWTQKATIIKDRFIRWMRAETSRPQDANEIMLPVPFPKQRQIIYDPTRYKVLVCGRRFGKTTAALMVAVQKALEKKDQTIFYVTPTYKQAKQNAWKPLLSWIGNAYKRVNQQELVVEFHNGSSIHLKGVENADSLRGANVHFAILDEYGDIKPEVWDEIIAPMLGSTKGGAMFIGTPKGYNHFRTLWMKAFRGELGSEWRAYRLTSYDNPYYDDAEIEKMRSTSDPRAFAQEYMAEFVQFKGLVYADFELGRHVQEFDVDEVKGVYVEGLDFGADHPTACIFVKVSTDGTYYVWDEHYEREMSAKEHADEIKDKRGKRKVPRVTYLDPSAKGFKIEMKRAGIRTKKANNDRDAGISKLRSLLREDKLVIHPRCANLIYEFQHHVYKKVRMMGAQSDGKDKAEGEVGKLVKKVDDDALDALRYAVLSYDKPAVDYDDDFGGDVTEKRALAWLDVDDEQDMMVSSEYNDFV